MVIRIYWKSSHRSSRPKCCHIRYRVQVSLPVESSFPTFTQDFDLIESLPLVNEIRGGPCGGEQSDYCKAERIEMLGKAAGNLPAAAGQLELVGDQRSGLDAPDDYRHQRRDASDCHVVLQLPDSPYQRPLVRTKHQH